MSDQFLAVDFGADSGRVMLATLDAGLIKIEELHRFPNRPLHLGGSIRWDLDTLFGNVLIGLTRAAEMGAKPRSISCDTWGVDFGLLDGESKLVEPSYCYRDTRTDGIFQRMFAKVPRERIYGETGIQFMQFNTVFQMLAASHDNSGAMGRSTRFLFIADLINHWLGGDAVAEQSLASTAQMMDPRTMSWSSTLCAGAGVPPAILPPIVPAGTKIGTLKAEWQKKTGLGPCDIVASCSHDTAAAVAAVPAVSGDSWAYLSCGTWSLLGAELPEPIINEQALEANFTNEVGLGGTIRFLKNITGLWIVQECRRDWETRGMPYTFQQLSDAAVAAEPFRGFINPDCSSFATPGEMSSKVQNFLADTAQRGADEPGQIVRMILESLAMRYGEVISQMEQITGRGVSRLHMVGGGTKDQLLCQFTANAIGRPVHAGPVEATALGNALVQALACGAVRDHAHLRDVVRASCQPTVYEPQDSGAWEAARREYRRVTAQG